MPKRPGGDVVTNRELNRALLARQMLLERAETSAQDALRQLVGLQSQNPMPPYLALWSRLKGFVPGELSELIERRVAVRIALLRSTIHTVLAEDAAGIRPLVQPVIERSFAPTPFGKATAALDLAPIADEARTLLEDRPLSWSALGERLRQRWPGVDGASLAHVARTHLPLVQVPPRGLWGRSGPAEHTTLEAWTGKQLRAGSIDELALRYLAAFGPASAADMQSWCGLTRLGEVFERVRPGLVTFSAESGVELFDLPDAPRPPGDAAAPVRFLGEYDNVLLSHQDRSRVMEPAHKNRVFTNNGIIRSILMVDGMLRGTWKLQREKSGASLDVVVFEPLQANERDEVEGEVARLLEFLAPGETVELRISDWPA